MLEKKNGKGCQLEQRGQNSQLCMGTAGKGHGSTAFLSEAGATSPFHVEEDRLQQLLQGGKNNS